jgi:hypothetical protein
MKISFEQWLLKSALFDPWLQEHVVSHVCQEEFENIRIRKSKKNRQHNGQKKKYRRTNNDLQNIHIKLKIE